MKRFWILLAALLVLTGSPFCFAAAETSFTGQVTYRSGKNVYLQNGQVGKLVFLDSANEAALMDAVRVGKVVTVSGVAAVYKQAGYHIPELTDAMIQSVADSGASASTVSATLDQLGDGLMAVKIRVKATKGELAAAGLQLSLDKYEEDQVLTVTGVLSANTRGRIILGARIQAAATPAPTEAPTSTPTAAPTPTSAPEITASPAPTATEPPEVTVAPTSMPVDTPQITEPPAPSPSDTPQTTEPPDPADTPQAEATATPTSLTAATPTQTPRSTPGPTAKAAATSSPKRKAKATPTPTAAPTFTPSPEPSATGTPPPTPSPVSEATASPLPTPTPTAVRTAAPAPDANGTGPTATPNETAAPSAPPPSSSEGPAPQRALLSVGAAAVLVGSAWALLALSRRIKRS